MTFAKEVSERVEHARKDLLTTSAEDGGSVGQREVVRQLGELRGVRGGVLLEGAIDGEARAQGLGAQRLKALAAHDALKGNK